MPPLCVTVFINPELFNIFMELDQFISQTIKSVIKGIKDSQEFALTNGARLNPYVDNMDLDKHHVSTIRGEEGYSKVYNIDFDIAVTTSSSNEKGGEAGINVYSLKLGGKSTDTEKNESLSRIKFSLDIDLPKHDY